MQVEGRDSAVTTMVHTPFDQPNLRGIEGDERALNQREKVKRVTKITAYGRTWGRLKTLL